MQANKSMSRSSYLSRRNPTPSTFQFQLTNSHSPSRSPLTYSTSERPHKLIDLQQVPSRLQVYPSTTQFQSSMPSQKHCQRRDCMDRKFRAVKTAQRTNSNVKRINPSKVDIVLQDNTELQATFSPGIHSFKRLTHKSNTEKDVLKEFRELEEARKDLKSRRDFKNRSVSLSLNIFKSSQTSPTNRGFNPEKSNLYVDVKNRISKRYNSMFRKYAQNYKEELKGKQQFFKGLCRATSIGIQKQALKK